MDRIKPFRPFIIVLMLLVTANLVLEHVNERFWVNDFRVYYSAADNLRHGLPVYDQVFGEDTGLYKYAPVVLYAFLPFTYLSFDTAGILHLLVMGLVTIGCFIMVERTLARFVQPLPRTAARALLGLLCIVVLYARELHMGNINMGLILLSALGVERLIAGKRVAAGAALGVVWLIKPYLLLMIVPLVVRREWRVLGTGLLAMLAGLLAPMVLQGPATGWALNRQWFHSMQYHTQVMFSPDRLGQIVSTHTGIPPTLGLDLFFIALAGLLLAAFTWRNTRKATPPMRALMDRAMELWLAMAIVPDLVITDQQHFMFSLPLILFAMAYFFTHRDPLAVGLFILVMVLYATRSSDLWGSATENMLVSWGILGVGNLLLILFSWWLLRRWPGTGPAAAP